MKFFFWLLGFKTPILTLKIDPVICPQIGMLSLTGGGLGCRFEKDQIKGSKNPS